MFEISLSTIKQVAADAHRHGVPEFPKAPAGGKTFSQVLEGLAKSRVFQDLASVDAMQTLPALHERLKNGEPFKPAALLAYQIKTNELVFKMELLSRAADALAAVPRKLQNQA